MGVGDEQVAYLRPVGARAFQLGQYPVAAACIYHELCAAARAQQEAGIVAAGHQGVSRAQHQYFIVHHLLVLGLL